MYGKKKKIPSRIAKEEDKVFLEYEKQLFELEIKRREIIEYITSQVDKNFINNNGCKDCRGRGWIIQQDVEISYPPCPNPNCTPDSRLKSGLAAKFTDHDRKNSVTNPCGPANPIYSIIVSPLDSLIREILSKIVKARNALKEKGKKY